MHDLRDLTFIITIKICDRKQVLLKKLVRNQKMEFFSFKAKIFTEMDFLSFYVMDHPELAITSEVDILKLSMNDMI